MASISFSEFSPLFISHILGSAVVESWLNQVVGDRVIHFQHLGTEGTATLELGEISRAVGDCEVVFDVPLQLKIKFSIPVLAESYESPAELHVFLKAEIYEPALLYLKARRVRDEDISIAPGVTGGLGLAQALGSQFDLFDRALRRKIRSEINARLRATRSARLIDLSALAFETMLADPHPRPGRRLADKPGLVPAGLPVSEELEPGAVHTYATALGAGELAKFVVYTATDVDGLIAHGSFDACLPADAGGTAIQSLAITTDGAWLGDYRRHECSLRAEEAGICDFQIANHEQAVEGSFCYTIRQERTKREPADSDCFAPYGLNLVRRLVSPALLERKLKSLLPKTRHFGPLALLGLTRVEGDAEIEVVSVKSARPPRRMEDMELSYRVVLRITPDVTIGVLQLVEKWRVDTRVTLHLHVHAVSSPLSLQIDPDELKVSAVKVVESKCLEGSGHFDDWKLLTRTIARPLVDEIRQMLDETEGERIINIERLARDANPPAKSDGRLQARELTGRLPIQKTIEGVIGAGQVPHYVAVALGPGHTLELDLAWFLASRPAQPFTASLAVCDEFRGVLESVCFTVGEAGKSDRTRLTFVAQQAGAYCFRVRIEPSEMAREARLEYSLQVRVS